MSDTLDDLRQRGAARVDPIRWRQIEALARRAAGHEGLARQLLDDKLALLVRSLSDALASTQTQMRPQEGPVEPRPEGLASLVAHIAAHKPAIAPALEASAPATGHTARGPVDPTTLQFFRRTWSRLSSDQRLAQSRSSLPQNAGPLNSQHLVHRSLNVMRELSPEYFDLFIAHIDTLLWLERANEQAAKEVGLPPRAKGGKKAGGGRRG